MSGILGQVVPTAPTVLYKSPNKYASTTLQIANISGTADTYDVAVRDYDISLNLVTSSYNNTNLSGNQGLILSDRFMVVSTTLGNLGVDVNPGDTITFLDSGTSTPTGTTAKVAKTFRGYTQTDITIVARPVDVITVTTFSAGTIEIGDQLTDGTDVGTVKDISDPGGGADITLVVEMTSGNFIDTEVLDNVTQATTSVTTVVSVVATASDALFNDATNNLFNGLSTAAGNLYVLDLSDSSLATAGFEIYEEGSLTDIDDTHTLRFGTPGVDGTYYFWVDDSSLDLYYVGDSANGVYANITNEIDTTGVSSWGADDSVLLYEVTGGVPQVSNDFSANGNTFTVQSYSGTVAGYSNGKFNSTDSSLKVYEYGGTFADDTLLYNSDNDLFYLVTSTTFVTNESWIAKGVTLNSASSTKFAGLILGPYENVVVDCNSAANTAFTLIGFEEDL